MLPPEILNAVDIFENAVRRAAKMGGNFTAANRVGEARADLMKAIKDAITLAAASR